MPTLLMPLVGPMQSWGIKSKHHYYRDTGREPSKSGVVGIIAAALGRDRSEDIQDLTALQFAVRVDRPGIVLTDYHTLGTSGYRTGDGGIETRTSLWSNRDYLADAAFLVALASEDRGLLTGIHAALKSPIWPLFLGRKSFVPSIPLWLPGGLVDAPILNGLLAGPWFGNLPIPPQVSVIWDDKKGLEYRYDVPLSFAKRTFAARSISRASMPLNLPGEGGAVSPNGVESQDA